MQFKENTLQQFVEVTAGSSPVPGGGSVSALCATLGSALAEMVANLTIGKKNYLAVEAQMLQIVEKMSVLRGEFLQAIDDDSVAFDTVMSAFKLPKVTDEEKTLRRNAINKATLYAAKVPLQLAEKCANLFTDFDFVAKNGNKNALSDIAVATMLVRTAILGALYNVKINLASLPDSTEKEQISQKVEKLQQLACQKENEILSVITL